MLSILMQEQAQVARLIQRPDRCARQRQALSSAASNPEKNQMKKTRLTTATPRLAPRTQPRVRHASHKARTEITGMSIKVGMRMF